MIHDQAAVGERGAGQAGRGDRAGPVRRRAGDDFPPRQAGGGGGVRSGRRLAGGDGRPDRRETGVGGQGRDGGFGGEDIHARRNHGGTGRRPGIGRGMDRHAGPGGAQVAEGGPRHAPAWADRPGAPGAGRGAAAFRGEAAGGSERNAADPGGGLADPL